ATATAVALNLTAVGATTPTYLTVWPHGTNRPATSNLNPTTSAAVANFAIVNLDPDGAITIWNQAGSVNVLADIVGYYLPTPAFGAITPTRLFDTRYGTGGVHKAPLGAGGTLTIQVAGTGLIPA